MKQHYFYFLLVLFFINNHCYSQELECGAGELHDYLMQTDSLYRKGNLQMETQIKSYLDTPKINRNTAVTHTIPVVVHVIHLGEALGYGTNISSAVITSAIAKLNSDFATSAGTGINMELQFCLATIDPNGNPTTGINRINGASVANYAASGINYSTCTSAANETAIKNLSKWPGEDYYNIWVVNKICGGWGGYAYLPSNPANENDGTVIPSIYMNNLDGALTHELGHGFGLYHTFEGDNNDNCPVNISCSTYGDKVCDTPPHKKNNCSSTNSCSTTGTWDNSLRNFMSYCGTKNRFTQGQKNRVQASLTVFPRLRLLSSTACFALDLPENEKVNLKIYPNPAKDNFTLSHTIDFSEGNIQIYNLLGRKLWEEKLISNHQVIATSNLDKGIYLVNITLDNFQHTEKLVVE